MNIKGAILQKKTNLNSLTNTCYQPLSTVPTTYPFQLQSTPEHTNSILIAVGMYVYPITCPLILTISPAAILNLPTNLFYLLDTALVLTSDNFLLIFSPSIPLQSPGGTFQKLSSDAIFVVCSHTFAPF